MDDYEFYLIGCEKHGIMPDGRLRFQVDYTTYNTSFKRAMSIDVSRLSEPRQEYLVNEWTRLVTIASLVKLGREFAGSRGYGDDPGGAGAAVGSESGPPPPGMTRTTARLLPKMDSCEPTDKEASLQRHAGLFSVPETFRSGR